MPLAVLIYMYLLYRHPLRGGKVHDVNDPQRDENLAMGENALFIEHPTDPSNRVKVASGSSKCFTVGRSRKNSIYRDRSLFKGTVFYRVLLQVCINRSNDHLPMTGKRHW
jgi:hypothetical protein